MGTQIDVIQIGQRITNTGVYGGRGVVTRIHGEQSPGSCRSLLAGVAHTGGTAHFDIAWEDGHSSPYLPECILRGGPPWRIEDDIADAGAVAAAVQHVADTKAAAEAAELVRAAEIEHSKAQALAAHPYLERAEGNAKSGPALAAANIRRQLKREFPGVAFRVTSKSRGTSSVDVHWTDGPTEKQVGEAVTYRYQEGHFDGMDDMYHYDRDAFWPDIFGGARYVTCNRAYTVCGLRRAWKAAGFDRDPLILTESGEWDVWAHDESDRFWIRQTWKDADLR